MKSIISQVLIGTALKDVDEKASQVTTASKDIENRNRLILGEMQKLRDTADSMQRGVEEITTGAHRIGSSSNEVAKDSSNVCDAIGNISGQINQFKV